MTQSSTLDGGMDVHQKSIAVAYVAKDHHAEVVYLGTIGTPTRRRGPRGGDAEIKGRNTAESEGRAASPRSASKRLFGIVTDNA